LEERGRRFTWEEGLKGEKEYRRREKGRKERKQIVTHELDQDSSVFQYWPHRTI
jgi:hypothetical protein